MEKIKAVMHRGRVVETEVPDQMPWELPMRAKQLNEIAHGKDYEVMDLEPGFYVDGYGRTLEINPDGTITIHPSD
jgi:hypothetical protein